MCTCRSLRHVQAHLMALRNRPQRPNTNRCIIYVLKGDIRSVDHLLQLLHWESFHGLRSWLGLEDARLLRKRIPSLAGWPRRLNFQFHVERTGELERTGLFQLLRCQFHHTDSATALYTPDAVIAEPAFIAFMAFITFMPFIAETVCLDATSRCEACYLEQKWLE